MDVFRKRFLLKKLCWENRSALRTSPKKEKKSQTVVWYVNACSQQAP